MWRGMDPFKAHHTHHKGAVQLYGHQWCYIWAAVVLPSAGLPSYIPILLFLLPLLLIQPHAETIQGADSWLCQESDYFLSEELSESAHHIILWACTMWEMGTCLGLSGAAGTQQLGCDQLQVPWHCKQREDPTKTLESHCSHVNKGTAPLKSSREKRDVS